MTEQEYDELNKNYFLNDPKNNLYSKPNLQAWRQAIELSGSLYKVRRAIVNSFDEKGRPNNEETIDYIPLAIVPVGDYSVNRKEQGSWTAESYDVSYVYPDYLRVEEVIEHPNYGLLKVISVNDMREYGISTAKAVRINSIRIIKDKGEWL